MLNTSDTFMTYHLHELLTKLKNLCWSILNPFHRWCIMEIMNTEIAESHTTIPKSFGSSENIVLEKLIYRNIMKLNAIFFSAVEWINVRVYIIKFQVVNYVILVYCIPKIILPIWSVLTNYQYSIDFIVRFNRWNWNVAMCIKKFHALDTLRITLRIIDVGTIYKWTEEYCNMSDAIYVWTALKKHKNNTTCE